MKKIILLTKIFLLSIFIPVVNADSNYNPDGYEVARKITQRYFDNQKYCGDDDLPAFLCSGVLLRGTVASDKYHSWNPNPHSQESGGVSFSYLRHDVKFSELAFNYNNGYIFSPYIENLADKIHPETLCYFPVDASTAYRNDKGCGYSSGYPNGIPCQQQGITTAEQWVNNYVYVIQYNNPAQCGFDVTGAGSADAFMQGIKVRSLIQLSENNEIILATWPQDIPDKLPIEAFFYRAGGLSGAQHDQRDFHNITGVIIPIIQMTLPYNNQDASFIYNPEDQAVNP
ncbi:hypothetical protein BDD26_3398 [Xenorhabdus cabanillasii]|uniref:Halovibrin HvnA n=1 Tax=Xenorhabdus cabanillasii TaxID=351673 RepID=A0A3D9UJ98_9GAMM|nr:N-acyl homoserine lactonase [Xenorhabdus cabanillasii]REF28483.1 hypothetical protein BDD26_3398 [Xenorhabdus cabanillasii]